jgi:hypothetical protein
MLGSLLLFFDYLILAANEFRRLDFYFPEREKSKGIELLNIFIHRLSKFVRIRQLVTYLGLFSAGVLQALSYHHS